MSVKEVDMPRNNGVGAQVSLPLRDLGPVQFDPTTESLVFQLQDTGQVVDALGATAKELAQAWSMRLLGEQAPQKS